MWHDFSTRHGGKNSKCDKGKGIMSYSENPNYKHPWSSCSKNDFQKQYNNILNMKMSWCLEAVSSNFCGSSGTGSTTKAPSPTTEDPGEGGPGDYDEEY